MARQKPALGRNWEAAPTLPKGARQKTLCGLQAPQYPYTCQLHAIILTPFSSSHFLSYLKLLQLMGSPPPYYFLLITLLFWLCSPCCSHSLYLPLLLSLFLCLSPCLCVFLLLLSGPGPFCWPRSVYYFIFSGFF